MQGGIEGLPAGYRAVTPTMDDIGRVTAFFNLVEISEWGVPDYVESEIEEEWADLDLEKSVVLVEDETGQIVAGMTLTISNGVTWEASGYTHPEYQQQGLGSWVVRWSEAMVRSRENETPEGYRVIILNHISTVNQAAQQLLAGEGYALEKIFRRMSIELKERPASPTWPEGFELRPFMRERDQHAYFDVIQTGFAEHWSASPRTFDSWSKAWLGAHFDPNLFLQVMLEDRVIATCCGKAMGDIGWIGFVATIPEYRRRGLARVMLQESFGRFWDTGISQIDLGVDSENRQSAVHLYRGVGMNESHSYETHRKILREGIDWRDEDSSD